ncbi:TldD/PmbA family protein [Candidatus Bipolaricaulota bacterium]|nr:TldD/PmbA family protein [Candidatus Bipolaricaulota bacterium]
MKLLEEANKKATSAEVYVIESQSLPVKFTAGELESVKSYETSGAALRVINDGRLGFSTTTDLADAEEIVDRALETATIGEEVGFNFPGPQEATTAETFDRNTARLSPQRLMEMGNGLIDEVTDFDSKLDVNVSLQRSSDQVRIANSNGVELSEKRSSISASIDVKQVGKEDIFSFSDSCQAASLDKLDVSGLLERVKQRLKWAELQKTITTGRYPVIFTPRGLIVLLLPLLTSFNGMNVYQGTSRLGDKIGEEVVDSRLSLLDGGVFPDSPFNRNFDDEGIPTFEKKLIEDGVVKNFLYDVRSAHLAGKKPTGNGTKGGMIGGSDFRSLPDAAPINLVIPPGERSFGKMISDIDRGLLVDQVLGLGQGNVLSGEFSNNVSVAYCIEDGAISGRVKNTMIAGNVFNLLQDNLVLAGQTEWVGGDLKGPAIAVDGVSVVQKD